MGSVDDVGVADDVAEGSAVVGSVEGAALVAVGAAGAPVSALGLVDALDPVDSVDSADADDAGALVSVPPSEPPPVPPPHAERANMSARTTVAVDAFFIATSIAAFPLPSPPW